MFRTQTNRAARRPGVILLVVLALLTLFAIVGVSFVLYANAEANSSRIFREAEGQTQADMDPDMLFAYFLNQLLYDVPDDASGVYSAMRGHSLSRSMYGYNYSGGPFGATPSAYVTTTSNGLYSVPVNVIPFNGTGRLHTAPSGNLAYNNNFLLDDYYMPNYTYFPNAASPDTSIRDPERYQSGGRSSLSSSPGPYIGGANVPYTYPDWNNMFLAAVMADGTVLAPSFHRVAATSPGGTALFGSLAPPGSTGSSSNWTTAGYEHMIMRPRPAEMGPGFPFPEDGGGDVKNLPFSPGTIVPGSQRGSSFSPSSAVAPSGYTSAYYNNDSIWMDLGAPVMTAPDGTKFKPLFAPLITDLDNRLNLNVHGNVRGYQANLTGTTVATPYSANGSGAGAFHRSNQGWGSWEVSLEWALNATTTAGGSTYYEWPQGTLSNFSSAPPPSTSLAGRYGVNQIPGTPGATAPGAWGGPPGTWGGRFYSPVDYDGSNELATYGVTTQLTFPGNNGNAIPAPSSGTLMPYTPFPYYPQGYESNSTSSSPTEGTYHPLLYNFFQPSVPGLSGSDDLVVPISNMEALLRYGDTNSPALTSDLFALLPNNLNPGNSTRRLNLLATHTFDYDTAGSSPWIWDPSQGSMAGAYSYVLPAASGTATGGTGTGTGGSFAPSGGPVPFPTDPMYGTAPGAPVAPPTNPPTTFPPTGSEFSSPASTPLFGGTTTGLADWRAISVALGKVDLNRDLPNYPAIPTSGTDPVFLAAQAARQQMAADIFLRLLTVTGATSWRPVATGGTPTALSDVPSSNAVQWLAQLAVNIVDFIDSDDIMTPFFWQYTNGQTSTPATDYYVVGTELPRLVLNEVYMEYDNDPNDPGLKATTPAATFFDVNVWVELMNPQWTDPQDPTGCSGAACLSGSGAAPNNYTVGTSIYQLVIAKPGTISRTYSTTAFPNPPMGVGTIPTAQIYSSVSTTAATGPTAGPPCVLTGLDFTTNAAYPTTGASPTILPNGTVASATQPPTPPTVGYLCTPGNGNGMYVIGPSPVATATSPAWGFVGTPTTGVPAPSPPVPAVSCGNTKMTYLWTVATNGPNPQTLPPTIILQRLAIPGLAWNDPASPTFVATSPVNPWVTVDYVDFTGGAATWPGSGAAGAVTIAGTIYPVPPVNNGATVPISGSTAAATPINQRASYGRSQPYAGDIHQWRVQQPNYTPTPAGALVNQPQHTMFYQNADALTPTPNETSSNTWPGPVSAAGVPTYTPFTWLYHMDRKVVSPMELLNVSGFRPFELTQQFMATPTELTAPAGGIVASVNTLFLSAASGTDASYGAWSIHGPIPTALVPGTVLVFEPGVSPTAPGAGQHGQESLVVASVTVGPTGQFIVTTTTNPQLNHPAGTAINVTIPHAQRAPWFDSTRRIYRLFEFLETNNRALGNTNGARVPGKVNINTLWDDEIFLGIADPQSSNQFPGLFNAGMTTTPNPPATTPPSTPLDLYLAPSATSASGVTVIGQSPNANAYYVSPFFENVLLPIRTPSAAPTAMTGGTGTVLPYPVPSSVAGTADAPFWGMTSAPYFAPSTVTSQQYPTGVGVQNTFLRTLNSASASVSSTPSTAPTISPWQLFEAPPGVVGGLHPYQAYELMNKTYNNFTTRSNVFAVWLTVGFFQVVNDTVRPVQLGPEIGKAEGRNVRHRMFAIVDRSNLTLDAFNPSTPGLPPVFISGSGTPVSITGPPAVSITAGPITPGTTTFNTTQGTITGTAPTNALVGSYESIPWAIAPGMWLLIDAGLPNMELVNVASIATATAGSGTTITLAAPFTQTHSSPFRIAIPNSATATGAAGTGPYTVSVFNPSSNTFTAGVGGTFEGVTWAYQAPSGAQPGTSVLLAYIVPPTPPATTATAAFLPATIASVTPSTNMVTFSATTLPPVGSFQILYPAPVPGNPGPQQRLDPKSVPWLIRHYSIIQ